MSITPRGFRLFLVQKTQGHKVRRLRLPTRLPMMIRSSMVINVVSECSCGQRSRASFRHHISSIIFTYHVPRPAPVVLRCSGRARAKAARRARAHVLGPLAESPAALPAPCCATMAKRGRFWLWRCRRLDLQNGSRKVTGHSPHFHFTSLTRLSSFSRIALGKPEVAPLSLLSSTRSPRHFAACRPLLCGRLCWAPAVGSGHCSCPVGTNESSAPSESSDPFRDFLRVVMENTEHQRVEWHSFAQFTAYWHGPSPDRWTVALPPLRAARAAQEVRGAAEERPAPARAPGVVKGVQHHPTCVELRRGGI